MSADNWAECPRCWTNCENKRKAALNRVRSRYGKIDQASYERELRDAEALPLKPGNPTLREDYEVYIGRDCMFHVQYRAECQKCGFAFMFGHHSDATNKET